MIKNLLFVFIASALGIVLKKDLSYVSIILFVAFLLFVLIKNRKSIFHVLIACGFFFFITNYSIPNLSSSFDQEVVVTKVKENYYIMKSDKNKFVCYSDEEFNYRSKIHVKGYLTKLTINKSRLISSFNDYLYEQGVHYELTIQSSELIKKGDTIRPAIKDFLLKGLSDESQSMVSLLLLADKIELLDFYDDLIDLSVVQLFVISGFHLNILGGIFSKILKKENSLIIPLLLLPYVWLLNFAVPIMRAFLYLLILRLAKKFKLNIDKQSIIVMIAIGFLIYDYHLLFSLSFQLTFLVTFVICQLNNLQNNSILFRFVYRPIILQLSILPILLTINYQINPFAFILNTLLALPVTILYICSWIVAFVKIFDNIFYFLTLGMISLIKGVANLGPPLIMGKPTFPFIFMFYSAFYYLIYYSQLHHKKRTIIAFSFLMCLGIYQYYRFDIIGQEQVVFLDVGQGDSTLICGKHNQYNILIDTGGSLFQDIAVRKVIPYLKATGIRKIDLVVITHEDYDHYGALESLKENFNVGEVVNGWEVKQVIYQDFSMINLNQYYLPSAEDNAKSAVFSFNHAETDFLIMGDATKEIELSILNNHSLACDVLRTGHHGSQTSSDPKFIKSVDPQLAIISVGKNNYGLPDDEVFEILYKYSIPYYRTDIEGYIKVTKQGVQKNC